MVVLAGLVFTLFYLVGVASIVIPALPGVPVVAVGALLVAWMTDFEVLGWTTVIVTAALALLAWLLDALAAAVGAQRYGSSRAGLWGSIVGSILGLFFPPFGFLVGALVGAVAAELFVGRPFTEALKAGIGAFVGTLGGIVAKVVILITIAFVVYPKFF
jgi:uncharacterized protein YqgC (DUF456 family)